MGSHYTIDATHRVVRLTGAIPPELGSWCADLDAVFADDTYMPGFGFLSDRRGPREPPSDAYVLDGVRYLHEHRAQLRGCRWALVTDCAAMDGWARTVSLMAASAGIQFALFHEIDEAWEWLTEDRGED